MLIFVLLLIEQAVKQTAELLWRFDTRVSCSRCVSVMLSHFDGRETSLFALYTVQRTEGDIDGLGQVCGISNTLVMEIPPSCTESSIYIIRAAFLFKRRKTFFSKCPVRPLCKTHLSIKPYVRHPKYVFFNSQKCILEWKYHKDYNPPLLICSI